MNAIIGQPINSLELLKSRGPNPTLTDDEYAALANDAANEVRRLCSNLSLWNVYSTKDGIEIFERKSELNFVSENMLLAIITLPCTIEKLEKLVTPWLPYRLSWDTLLEDAQTIQSWPEKEVYLVRHLVKKLLTFSARESIDVIKIVRRENEVLFGSTGAAHGCFPPINNYVRTHQYLGGYLLRPCDSNPTHTKFHMLFHADLNLSGPKLLSSIAAKFKPRLMCQKIDNLKKAIDEFDI